MVSPTSVVRLSPATPKLLHNVLQSCYDDNTTTQTIGHLMTTEATYEQAASLVDRLSKEVGFVHKLTSGFLKVESLGNKHRIYIQRGKALRRIDTTLVLPADDPAYVPLKSPIGAISSHVTPTLEQLERVLRMLGDKAIETQVSNKPRPFAPTKQAAPRKPKAVAAPVPEAALQEVDVGPRAELKQRLLNIKTRAREKRIEAILDNPQKYGQLTREEAEAVVDRKLDPAEVIADRGRAISAELEETLAETGIEVVQ